MKVGHAITVWFKCTRCLSMILIRVFNDTQPVLEKVITWSGLKDILFIQRELQKPDIVLSRLLWIPAKDANPGVTQVGYGVRASQIFKCFKLTLTDFGDPASQVKYAHTSPCTGNELTD